MLVAAALAALIITLLALQTARLSWHRGQAGRALRERNVRSARGEALATSLLERNGFEIVEVQPVRNWFFEVSGAAQRVTCRADFLVRDPAGNLLVAEVKTGASATKAQSRDTRRQLLEYTIAYGVDRLLLVLPENDTIERVTLPRPELPPLPSSPLSIAQAFVVGAVLGVALGFLGGWFGRG